MRIIGGVLLLESLFSLLILLKKCAKVRQPRGVGSALIFEKWQSALSPSVFNQNQTAKHEEKQLRPIGHRSVELGFDLCLQQNVYPRVGVWLKDIGRGP